MTIFEWGPLLKRWSEEWLEALAAEDPEEFDELDEDMVRDRWLGFAPADPADIAALEERLGQEGTPEPLPPSLRSFLQTSDGWRHAGGFVYLLAGAGDIGRYGDPYDFGRSYEAALGAEPTEEEVRRAGMWRRAVQLSVDSDMTDVLLDPGDVDADGEWAVYVYHGWSGEPPDRYASFRAFMEDMYKQFYSLGGGHEGFENAVTRDLDAKVEEARIACLGGELDQALAVLGEAGELGRPRAGLLSAQLRALLEGGGWVPVDPRMDDPLYAGEVLPLKVRDHLRHRSWDDSSVLGPTNEDYAKDRERARTVLEQIRERTYAYAAPGPFGDAVKEARELARWGDTDGAWRVLMAAVPRWEPYEEDHVAPFGLLGDPLLGPLVTPERGRQLLMTPRAGQVKSASTLMAASVIEEEAARDGLGWLAHRDPKGEARRNAYRFVLVEGVRPEELAERFGTGPLEPPAGESELWSLQFAGQQKRYGPTARIGACDGWSFAFDSTHRPRFDVAAPPANPGAELSRGTRALTVRWAPGLFHFACAEGGARRYAFTVHEAERHRTGTIPDALDPDRLFPDPLGPTVDRTDERAALDAIAAAFDVSLPRFALDHGRLPTLPTRPWTTTA
ncbi:SMI1/KNR4 family protein [Streptomyces sp. NPDC087300]|uniref:SMI1/KNR4 family protein n=1 Tax=Streptomyces sp. NPDC087300 TaxID=3365780 RepID=UPI003813EE8C